MELKRKCEKRIIDWYNNEKKALLVTGARQVGKTHLIRSTIKKLGKTLIEINLISRPEVISMLDQARSADELVMALSTVTEEPFVPYKTIIFLDEIQRYKNIVTKIKFLTEDNRFRYILSGSLLGVELNNIESAPVGYLETIKMYPLDFEEFLQISNITEEVMLHLRECFTNKTPVLDAINDKMMDLFRRYLVVGGMPESVAKFAETYNLNDVLQIHSDIIELYKLDFTQYEANDKRLFITNIYDLVPSELLKQNRRFIVSDIKKGFRFERIESSFLWLQNSGVVITAYNATEPKVPLRLNEKQSLFKMYLSDVGLLTSIYGMNTKAMIIGKQPGINCGGIYENAVAQELYSKGFDVYYYNSNRLGELDFVIEYNGAVLPIEVKSGNDYTKHSAMDHCLLSESYNMPEGIVLANCNITAEGNITYLPVYMVMFLEKNETSLGQIEKIEF